MLIKDEKEMSLEEIEIFYDWWQDFIIECGSLIKALKAVKVFEIEPDEVVKEDELSAEN